MRATRLPLLFLALLLSGCPGSRPAGDAPREDEPLSIGQVQGKGERSPVVDGLVVVEGVVTGNFVGGLGGFFIQSPIGAEDGDPATSDGLFVEFPRDQQPRPKRGDRVLVHGRVTELGRGHATLTALTEARVEQRGRGQAATLKVAAAPASAGEWERLEGMQLEVTAPLVISGNGNLLRFGEMIASFDARLEHATELHPPGEAARRLELDNLRRQLIIDDARNSEFPRELWFLPEPLSPDAPLRAGSRLHGIRGVLDQRHGQYRLQLTEAIERVEQAPRPAAPVPPAGLRIVGMNVLNLFNGDGRGGGFPTARGATDVTELERQRRKIVQTLVALEPDIAALMEIENDGFGPRSSLARLVEELNTVIGETGDYRFVDAGEGPGNDEIRVALIYRVSRAEALGQSQSIVSGDFAGSNRPPLLQGFRPAGGGPAFAVVAVHLKSKGSCNEADEANQDMDDGQSCWNASRRAAAAQLSTWVLGDPAAIGSQHAVIIGDLNAHSQEDPLRLLREAGWQDNPPKAGELAHSYVFEGRAGRLDHALVSPALAPFVSGLVKWHANADESEAFDYSRRQRRPEWYREDPYRASDHDPLILGLDFSRPVRP